jgi:hypothetical protein
VEDLDDDDKLDPIKSLLKWNKTDSDLTKEELEVYDNAKRTIERKEEHIKKVNDYFTHVRDF